MQGVSTVLLPPPGKNKSQSTEKKHYSYQLKYQNSCIWNHKNYCDWTSYTNSIFLACKKRDWNYFKWLDLLRKLNSILLLFTERTHVIAGPVLGWFRGNVRSCLWHCTMVGNTSSLIIHHYPCWQGHRDINLFSNLITWNPKTKTKSLWLTTKILPIHNSSFLIVTTKVPRGKETTDNPLPSGTRLLTVGKLFTFNKKFIIKLKFQMRLYYLESSILESFYSATSPALSGKKRYWLDRKSVV